MTLSALKKEALAACGERLKGIGFEGYKGGIIYGLKMRPEFLMTVGLLAALRDEPGAVTIAPVVGVRSGQVQALVDKFSGGLDQVGPMTTTVTSPLGYLMPERTYRRWVFRSKEEASSVAEDLVSAVQEYGMTFADHNATLEQLTSTLHAKPAMTRLLVDKREAIILALLGNQNGARNALFSHRCIVERGSPNSEEVHLFLERFSAYFGFDVLHG